MKRENSKIRNINTGNILTILAVIAIIVGLSVIGIRLMKPPAKSVEQLGTEEDKDLTENLISREKALKTINKSIGSAKILDDYQLFDGKNNEIVKGVLAEEDDTIYKVWHVDQNVSKDILIGFLFDEDSKIVWSESSSKDFWNPNVPKIDLSYTDKKYQSEMNFKDGAFSYKKRNTAIAILGPEQGENVSSVWAYNIKDDSLSLVWYNTIFMAEGEKY